MGVFRKYYLLTKPGIIRGNLFTATAGFLLGCKGHFDWTLLLAVWGGVALVIASGCVFNNYIDRGIDVKMKRTKKRALVTGAVSGQAALTFGTVLGLAGFTLLGVCTNLLTVAVGFVGFVFYVVIYGIVKRMSPFGTVVGSVSGAIPPVAGYTAAANALDGGALLLFAILSFWQMPHFYSIAMYRSKEYAAAGIPVLPLVKGMRQTKIYILIYIVAFLGAVMSLTVFGYTGYLYLAVALLFGLVWLWKGVQGFKALDDNKWARTMFGYSLLALMAASIMICVDALLPG
jgi:protoheme IX farnesyltransferase